MAATATSDCTSTKRPQPSGRIFLSAQWRALAMLNWEIEPRLLAPDVPRGTELDFFAGKTYLSLVGFVFRDTYLLGLPIPWHRNFEEINLRYYLRREDKRAVCFLREVVQQRSIAWVARWAYNESYVCHKMCHRLEGYGCDPAVPHAPRMRVEYSFRHRGDWLSLGVQCGGPSQPLAAGSHEEFIAEHYYGYCRQRDGGTIEYRVEHPPWRIFPADRSWISPGIAGFYPPAFARTLSRPPDSAFLADGSAVRVYQPQRIA